MSHLALLLALAPLASDDPLGLRHAWTTPLGPAYSRVAVSGSDVVTQYSDGKRNYVVALDAADGSERWRQATGPVYLGHDGSEDGPVSTPAIGRDTVYALGPRGKLVALDRKSGELRWSTHLVQDLGAEEPEYGFTTSPLVVDATLVVQAGGSEGRNLCGLDAATGELLWSLGDGTAAYQSPALLELHGMPQLVVLNGLELQGVEPETGELLWRHELGPRSTAGTGSAGAIDDARFFLYVSGQLAVFELGGSPGAFEVKELYRSRELGNTYAKPVYHDGHFYGFKSTFLTCVDAENGRRVWKSRPPGGRGLVLAGDRLVVFGSEGVVAIVLATPEGYIEEARVQALEHSGYAWPSFADGKVYVRNSAELSCLAVVEKSAGSPVTAATTVDPEGHAFGVFLEELRAAPIAEQGDMIDAFLDDQAGLPIQEGELVHFVYRGEAQDVAVLGSMTDGGQADPLHRVADTDLYHRTYEIEPGARWEYRYQVDYEAPVPDPANPRTAPGRRGPVSEVVTAGYEVPAHLETPGGPRGSLEGFEFESWSLGNTRKIEVYVPPGYDPLLGEYPLLLVHEGPAWLEKGAMATSLDNLIGDTVQPLVVAFIAPLDEWWFESGGSKTEAYLAMLANELVPNLEERYALSSEPSDRALMGVKGFGLTAAFGLVAQRDVFGKAAIQSVFLGDVARHAFFEELEERPPRKAVFYVDWNRYEPRDPDRGVDYAADSARLVEALRAAGCTVVGGEALDAHGWGSWRARTDEVLQALFPLR